MIERPRARRVAVASLALLAGCDRLFGVDFSNAQLAAGGTGGGSVGAAGGGGSDGICPSGFPDSTPYCVDASGAEVACSTAPECAGHWIDAGPSDRFSLEGTDIRDRVTGLLWSGATIEVKGALPSCPEGFELPTRIELLSIVDYGRAEPAADGSVFFESAGAYLTLSRDSSETWLVDMSTGDVRRGSITDAVRARCKKGRFEPRFEPAGDNGDEALRETRSGLLFRKSPLYAQSFVLESSICALVDPSPCGPWRAPSIKEMQLAVQDAGSLDPQFELFDAAGAPRGYTASPKVGAADEPSFWVVHLRGGHTGTWPLSTSHDSNGEVYCVSGGTLSPASTSQSE